MKVNMPITSLVVYRTDGRNGLVYDLPAIVTCTRESHPGDYPDGKANPLPVPAEGCVHITVFSPGGFGTEIRVEGARYTDVAVPEDDADFKGATALIPGSGTYVEWNVPVWQFPGDWQEMLAFDRNKVPHRTVRSFI